LSASNLVIPKHIAIIMDGNGRWAKAQGKLRTFGHKKGVQVAREIVQQSAQLGVQSLSLFAFSSENWQRPKKEVSFIMGLFVEALHLQVKELHENKVRLRFIGDRSTLSGALNQKMTAAEHLMQENTGLQLNVAVSYGGKWDILNAMHKALHEKMSLIEDSGMKSEEGISKEKLRKILSSLNEVDIEKNLQTLNQDSVDLLIRTGGESRISNFLLWQIAYAELIFSPVLWPEFSGDYLLQAIEDFSQRQRRFGKTGEQTMQQNNQQGNH